MRDILSHSDKEKRKEMLRFVIVGTAAVGIQYGAYLLLTRWFLPEVANTFAYLLSFVFNYFASVRYTFRVQSTARRGAGFALSHLINYLMQTALLAFFLRIGIQKEAVMIPVFVICVPVNFLLVRYFLKKRQQP